MHKLSIISNKKMPFLQYIALGIKKAECRIASDKVRSFRVGDKLLLQGSDEFALCEITYMHFYKSFEDMVLTEKAKNVVPFVNINEEAIKIYKSFPGWQRVKSVGICAIGVKHLESKLKFNIDTKNF